VAVLLPAAVIVGMVTDAGELNAYAKRTLALAGDGVRVELLLLNLHGYCKAAAVMAAGTGGRRRSGGAGGGGDVDTPPIVSRTAVLDAMTFLQVEWGITHMEVPAVGAAVDYLARLTIAIAGAPHRRPATFLDAVARRAGAQKRNDDRHAVVADGTGADDGAAAAAARLPSTSSAAAFLSAAAAATGPDGVDVAIEGGGSYGVAYLDVLTRVPGCTAGRAATVRRAHPTLGALLAAVGEPGGVAALAELRVGDKNRRLGPSMAAALALVFTCADPMRRIQRGDPPPGGVGA